MRYGYVTSTTIDREHIIATLKRKASAAGGHPIECDPGLLVNIVTLLTTDAAKLEPAKTTLRVNIGEALMACGGVPYAEAAIKASTIVDFFFAKTLPTCMGSRP